MKLLEIFKETNTDIQLDKNTLIVLRWLANIGQLLTISFVYFILNFEFPFYYSLLIISFGILTNIFLQFREKKKLLSNFYETPNKNFPLTPDFIILAGLSPYLKHIKKCGLISIPQFLIPRKIKLLTRITRDTLKNDDIKYASWLVTLGDWDIF